MNPHLPHLLELQSAVVNESIRIEPILARLVGVRGEVADGHQVSRVFTGFEAVRPIHHFRRFRFAALHSKYFQYLPLAVSFSGQTTGPKFGLTAAQWDRIENTWTKLIPSKRFQILTCNSVSLRFWGRCF